MTNQTTATTTPVQIQGQLESGAVVYATLNLEEYTWRNVKQAAAARGFLTVRICGPVFKMTKFKPCA